MRRIDRPVPFPYGTEAYREEFKRIRSAGVSASLVRGGIWRRNWEARSRPLKGERCMAKTKKGTPCQAKAMWNGRCMNHGGMSAGPTSPEGKARALANLRNRK
jgi:hypothetical protein